MPARTTIEREMTDAELDAIIEEKQMLISYNQAMLIHYRNVKDGKFPKPKVRVREKLTGTDKSDGSINQYAADNRFQTSDEIEKEVTRQEEFKEKDES